MINVIFLSLGCNLQDDPDVKMLVLLGEVGGIEEYTVCNLLKSGRITKPIVAWCIGTCSDMFSTDVQVWSLTHFFHFASCKKIIDLH